MQNTIEKGLKIHPLGTLVAILACMVIFYVCNFIVTKFSKNQDDDLAKEIKQRVEEVKLNGQSPVESDGDLQDRVEDIKATEKDIDKTKKEKIQANMGMEGKQTQYTVRV